MIDLLVYYLLNRFLFKPSKQTKKIAILGIKGAGKTTLWNGLRGNIDVDPVTTHYQKIEEFSIKRGKDEVKVASTQDIGGGDLYVPSYDELIKDRTFIYFLVDINTVKENKDAIRARLYKIFNIINGDNDENVKIGCGIKILVTHTDIFLNNSLKRMSEAQLVEYVFDALDITTIKALPSDMAKRTGTVNLNSSYDIETIKDEIINR